MSSIEYKVERHSGQIKINKPQLHNALNLKEIESIIRILDDWQGESLRSIIISGTGKSFCSGLDINRLNKIDWRKNPISILCQRIDKVEVPTICLLNGGAYGGGVEIAMSCDFRVATSDLVIGIPAAKLGIVYEPQGILKA